MTAVMVPTSGASGGGTQIASNNRGRAVIPGGTTVTLVSFVAGSQMLRGFHVEGDGDGFVWIEVDAVALDGLAARHTVVKEAYRILPNPETYPSAISIVALKVTNLSAVATEFQGVVFGE